MDCGGCIIYSVELKRHARLLDAITTSRHRQTDTHTHTHTHTHRVGERVLKTLWNKHTSSTRLVLFIILIISVLLLFFHPFCPPPSALCTVPASLQPLSHETFASSRLYLHQSVQLFLYLLHSFLVALNHHFGFPSFTSLQFSYCCIFPSFGFAPLNAPKPVSLSLLSHLAPQEPDERGSLGEDLCVDLVASLRTPSGLHSGIFPLFSFSPSAQHCVSWLFFFLFLFPRQLCSLNSTDRTTR